MFLTSVFQVSTRIERLVFSRLTKIWVLTAYDSSCALNGTLAMPPPRLHNGYQTKSMKKYIALKLGLQNLPT